jgi:hypothetical protein
MWGQFSLTKQPDDLPFGLINSHHAFYRRSLRGKPALNLLPSIATTA